jgi:hypothetical protein
MRRDSEGDPEQMNSAPLVTGLVSLHFVYAVFVYFRLNCQTEHTDCGLITMQRTCRTGSHLIMLALDGQMEDMYSTG